MLGLLGFLNECFGRFNAKEDKEPRSSGGFLRDFEDSVEVGFQLATAQGPMCAEPMQGMAVILQTLEQNTDGIEEDAGDDEPCWLRRSRRSTVARRRRRALHSRVSLAIDSTGEIGWSDR